VNIEFIDPVLPSRRAWMCVVGLGALAAVLFAAGRIMEARTDMLRDEARGRAAAEALAAAAPTPMPPPPYADDLRRALDRASLPEAPVLRELETVAIVGIQLTSIDIDMADHMATVELQADNDTALGEYLDQLNAGMPSTVWHIDHLAAVPQATLTAPTASATQTTQTVTLKRRF
jgi:hypothetical protein